MKRAVISVSPENLALVLHLPIGTQVIGAQWNSSTWNVELIVTHGSLPELPEGGKAPYVTLGVEFQ